MESPTPLLSPSVFEGMQESDPAQHPTCQKSVQYQSYSLSSVTASVSTPETGMSHGAGDKKLPEYRIAVAEEGELPETCPDWLAGYDKEVFQPLLRIYNVFADQRKSLNNLINGTGVYYNRLVVALMILDKACLNGGISEEHQKKIAGWLDDLLKDLPIDWRELPLVTNPDINNWQLPKGYKHLGSELDKNREIYLQSIGKESFVSPFLCSRKINGLDLGSIYIAYYIMRNENVSKIAGSDSLVAEDFFVKDPVLYDWLVLFRDKEKVQQDSGITDFEYNAMVDMLNNVDATIANIPGLKDKNKFKWSDLVAQPGMDGRWQVCDPEDSSAVSDTSSTITLTPVSSPVSSVSTPASSPDTDLNIEESLERAMMESSQVEHEMEFTGSPKGNSDSARPESLRCSVPLNIAVGNLRVQHLAAQKGFEVHGVQVVGDVEMEDVPEASLSTPEQSSAEQDSNPYAKKTAAGEWRELFEGEIYRRAVNENGEPSQTITGIMEPHEGIPERPTGHNSDDIRYVSQPAAEIPQMPEGPVSVVVSGDCLGRMGLAGVNDLLQDDGSLAGESGDKIISGNSYPINGARLVQVIDGVLQRLINSENDQLDDGIRKLDDDDIEQRLESVESCLNLLSESLDARQKELDEIAKHSDDPVLKGRAMDLTMIYQAAKGELGRLYQLSEDIAEIRLNGMGLIKDEDDIEDEVASHLQNYVEGVTAWSCYDNIRAVFDPEAQSQLKSRSGSVMHTEPMLVQVQKLPGTYNRSSLPLLPGASDVLVVDYKAAAQILSKCLPKLISKYSDSTEVWTVEEGQETLGEMVRLIDYLEQCKEVMVKRRFEFQPEPFAKTEPVVGQMLSDEHWLFRKALPLSTLKQKIQAFIGALGTRDDDDEVVVQELKEALSDLRGLMKEISAHNQPETPKKVRRHSKGKSKRPVKVH